MSLNVRGIGDLTEELNGIIGRVENPQPILRDFGEAIKTETENSFENERDPFGRPWRKSKRASKTGTKTLRDTTSRNRRQSVHLQDSINSRVRSKSVTIGTNIPYAKFHHHGTKKMVQRRFLPITDSGELPSDLAEELKSIAGSYIVDGE